MKFNIFVILVFVITLAEPGLSQHGFRWGHHRRHGGNGFRRRMDSGEQNLHLIPKEDQFKWMIGRECSAAHYQTGNCMTLSNCPNLMNILLAHPPQIANKYLLNSQWVCGGEIFRPDPLVCCHSNQNSNTFLRENVTTFEPTPPWTRPETTSPKSEIGLRSDSCKGPDLTSGVCSSIKNCPTLMKKLIANPKDATFIEFLKLSNSICGKAFAVVCCPLAQSEKLTMLPSGGTTNQVPTKLPTMAEGCGLAVNSDVGVIKIQVVGGMDSKIGFWPWIALIGYSDGASSSPFKCGGALITSRHVLTAAHCIRSDLSFVRLGEHDLSTDTETTHLDVPVTKVLKHPEYNRSDGRSDIALLYLDRNVEFSATITPICLPTLPELRTKSYVDRRPYVAGWGRTMEGGQAATVLQDLQLTVFENSVCRYLYKRQNKLVSEKQFDDAVICAGDLLGGKDTCQGDSGGPLMIAEGFSSKPQYQLIGVVSYGIGCARPDAPGVYTRVAKFMDWIENEIVK